MIIKSLHTSILTLLLSAVVAFGSPQTGPARIQGVVKDAKGQAISGAEVHISSKDGSGFQKIIRTDSGGNYGISNLPVTDYEVVLFVNGQIKASLNNQKVFPNKPTQMDFNLTGKYAANTTPKKHTHMVYQPAETGSHLGGHWVEVDDNTGAPQSGEVKHLGGEAARSFQRNSGTTGGGN
jgi:uncharacterized surface anchored protein